MHDYISQIVEAGNFTEFTTETTQLKLNIPAHRELFDELVALLSDFAVRKLYEQITKLLKSDYRIDEFAEHLDQGIRASHGC